MEVRQCHTEALFTLHCQVLIQVPPYMEVTAVTAVMVAVTAVMAADSDTEGDMDNGKNYRTSIATGTKGI